jgi:hypothetical protein
MKKLYCVAILAAWLCTTAPAAAYTQSFCAPLEQATALLAENGEYLIAYYRDGEVVKGLFGSRESGSWTLVAVDGSGYVCTMRNGAGLVAPSGDAA